MNNFSDCVTLHVQGKNFPLLFSKLSARKISFKNLCYLDKDKISITINSKDYKEFVAISKESWYNKKVGVTGIKSRLKHLFTKSGIILGALIFVFSCYFVNDYVLDVKILSDSYFLQDINYVLERENIKKYTKFSKIDYRELSNLIYSENPLISYVQVKKSGNTLVIQVEKSTAYSSIDKSIKEIVSTCDGEIIENIVYRGTPLKKVGDIVKAGDLLVTGEVVSGEEVFSTYVLARVSVLVNYTYDFECENTDKNKSYAILLAKLECGQEEYYSCEEIYIDGKFVVTLKYVKIFGGVP